MEDDATIIITTTKSYGHASTHLHEISSTCSSSSSTSPLLTNFVLHIKTRKNSIVKDKAIILIVWVSQRESRVAAMRLRQRLRCDLVWIFSPCTIYHAKYIAHGAHLDSLFGSPLMDSNSNFGQESCSILYLFKAMTIVARP